MTLLDAQTPYKNYLSIGFERVEFYFSCLHQEQVEHLTFYQVNHPMHVYQLKTDNVNPRTQIYTLKFISKKRYVTTKQEYARAFEDIDQMTIYVCKNYLKTKKDILVEETKGTFKYVNQELNPMSVIEYIRKKQIITL